MAVVGDWLRVAEARTTAVLETERLDVEALDDARRQAVAGVVARLCHGLDHDLQFVVQSRRWPAVVEPARLADERLAVVARRLDDATRADLAARLASDPPYRRTVLAVCAVDGVGRAAEGRCERAVARLVGHLGAAGIGCRRLAGADLATVVAEAWGSLGASPSRDPGSASPPDGTAPPPRDGTAPAQRSETFLLRPEWEVGIRQARCGSVLFRGIVLSRLPGSAVDCGWLAPLLRSPGEWDVSIRFSPLDMATAMARLGRRLRDLRAEQLVELDGERIGDATLEVGTEAALELRDRLARHLGRPLSLGIVAVARADDAADLERTAVALRLGLAATLAECRPCDFEHLAAALSAWPLGLDALGTSKLVDSAAAATCTPWVEAVCDEPDGYRLGRSVDHRTPIRLAPFATEHHSNGNVAVLAASGHGKSYLLGALVLEAAAHGVGSILVDPEGEHARLVEALGGTYLSLSPGCGTSINVFDIGDVDASDSNRRAEVVGAVVELVDLMCGSSLDDVERAHLDAAAQRALDEAQATGRPAILGDLLEHLEARAPRVAVVLGRFCSGPLGDLFNRPTSVRLGTPIVGIGLRDLKDEVVGPVSLVVAEWLWAVVRRTPRRRHLIFDEVGLLCVHPPLRRLLVQLARRCRKYGVSLVVATQNASDLLATEEGTVVATNPAIALLGGHRRAETQRMAEAFGLTETQQRALERASRGEFLLLASGTRLLVRIEVAAAHAALLRPADGSRR